MLSAVRNTRQLKKTIPVHRAAQSYIPIRTLRHILRQPIPKSIK